MGLGKHMRLGPSNPWHFFSQRQAWCWFFSLSVSWWWSLSWCTEAASSGGTSKLTQSQVSKSLHWIPAVFWLGSGGKSLEHSMPPNLPTFKFKICFYNSFSVENDSLLNWLCFKRRKNWNDTSVTFWLELCFEGLCSGSNSWYNKKWLK